MWHYFSLDLSSQLDDLTVTDQDHALNAMDQDLKLEDVDFQYKDLVVSLMDDGEGFSDPNLYVMLNDSAPDVKRNHLVCGFYGEDICVISGQEIQKKQA